MYHLFELQNLSSILVFKEYYKAKKWPAFYAKNSLSSMFPTHSNYYQLQLSESHKFAALIFQPLMLVTLIPLEAKLWHFVSLLSALPRAYACKKTSIVFWVGEIRLVPILQRNRINNHFKRSRYVSAYSFGFSYSSSCRPISSIPRFCDIDYFYMTVSVSRCQ